MRRDHRTGFEYPFYEVIADVWHEKTEEYECYIVFRSQTYEEALDYVRKTSVDNDTLQLKIVAEYEEDIEWLAIKVAITESPGYYFYDPRTDKEIA